jgi:hypothetical protein
MAQNIINRMKSTLRMSRERWSTVDLDQMAGEVQSAQVDSAVSQWVGACLSAPVLYVFATLVSALLSILGSRVLGLVGLAGLVVWPALAVMHFELSRASWAKWSAPLRKAVGIRVPAAPKSKVME